MIAHLSAPLHLSSRSIAIFAAVMFAPRMSAQAGASVEPPAAEYVVFFGLDLATNVKGVSCPVVAGSDTAVEVQQANTVVRVALKGAQLNTTIEPKLSRTRARLDDLTGDRVYSPISDPTRDILSQQILMDSVQAQNAMITQLRAENAAKTATFMELAAQDPNSGIKQSDVDAAHVDASMTESDANAAFVSPTYNSSLPGTAKGNDAFDAFAVSFRISTPEAFDDAYGVLRLMVRDPGNPRQVMQVLKFFNVHHLGPDPRKLTVQQFGLPKGFGVDSYAVHLYAGGRELPTNHSPNRVDVSADEAHQFLILRHLHTNGQASRPVLIIPEFLPAKMGTLVPREQRTNTVDLAIDRAGHVTKTSPGLPAELDTALRQLRFLPALVNGAAIDSQGTFALGEFVP